MRQSAVMHGRAAAATVRRVGGLLVPVKGWVALGTLALLAATGLQLVVAPLAQWLVNAVQAAASAREAGALLGAAGWIVLAFVARAGFSFVQSFFLSRAMQRLATRL